MPRVTDNQGKRIFSDSEAFEWEAKPEMVEQRQDPQAQKRTFTAEQVQRLEEKPFNPTQPLAITPQSQFGDIPAEPAQQLPPGSPPTLREVGLGATESLPIAGGLIGGILGGIGGGPTAPLTATAGAGAGAATGKSLENFIKSLAFPEEAPKTVRQVFEEPVEAAGEAAIGELAGLGIAKGGAKVLEKGAEKFERLRKFFKPRQKINAKEVEEAAENLGIKPTKGMLAEDPRIGQLESSLYQSPSFSGDFVRREVDQFRQGMLGAAEDITKAPRGFSSVEAGSAVKGNMAARSGERLMNAEMIYNDLELVFKNLNVSKASMNRLKANLIRMDAFRLSPKTNPAAKMIRNIVEDLDNVRTVADLKALRTTFNNMRTATMSSAEKQVIDKVHWGLTKARNNSIIKGAGKDKKVVLQNIKKADKLYKDYFEEIKEIDKALGGRASKTPKQFLDKLQDMPEEKVVDRLFNKKAYNQIRVLKEKFPESFNVLRDRNLEMIFEKSLEKGQLSPTKLVRQLSGLSKEVREIMFGKEGVKAFNSLKTLVNAVPKMAGPSGTPAGLELQKRMFSELTGLMRLIRYRGGEFPEFMLRGAGEVFGRPSSATAIGQFGRFGLDTVKQNNETTKKEKRKKIIGGQ